MKCDDACLTVVCGYLSAFKRGSGLGWLRVQPMEVYKSIEILSSSRFAGVVTPALISMTPASAGTRVLATRKISGVATTWEPAGWSSQVL